MSSGKSDDGTSGPSYIGRSPGLGCHAVSGLKPAHLQATSMLGSRSADVVVVVADDESINVIFAVKNDSEYMFTIYSQCRCCDALDDNGSQ